MSVPRLSWNLVLSAVLVAGCVNPSDSGDADVEAATEGDDTVGVLFGPPVVMADLVVTVVGDPPGTLGIGDTFTASDTVTNQGTADAGSTGSKYYLSTNGTTPHYLLGDRAVAALAIGASDSGTATLTVPLSVPEGSYRLLSCADSGFGTSGRSSSVDEVDENNNCTASAGSLTIGGADLVQLGVSISPPTLDSGTGTLTVTETVQNNGSGGAAASVTRYYLSTDSVRGNDAFIRNCVDGDTIPSRNVPALAAGESHTGTGAATPLCIRDAAGLHPPAPGTYFVIACADETHVVGEVDEYNNCAASSTTVTVVAGNDIAQIAVSNPPATGEANGTFTIDDTAQNVGMNTLPPTFTKFYLSSDGTAADLDFYLATRDVPSLAPNQTSTATNTIATIPANVTGIFFVVACADSGPGDGGQINEVVESNENNNCLSSSTTIAVGVDTSADLVISAVNNPPATGSPGSSFTLTGTTSNIGFTATGDFHNKYYLTLNQGSGITQLLLPGGILVAGLAAGASSPFSVMLTIPSGTVPRMYFVLVCADAGPGDSGGTSFIDESNELNNCTSSSAPITVQ